jgi:CDP-diacylglycerol--glycerol-3-phosphate 3-phosphatidyltransferase
MTLTGGAAPDVHTDALRERIGTPATGVTAVRTVLSVALAGMAVHDHRLSLLVAALAVYWIGDVADGAVARLARCETRIGAVLDILSDRFCAAAFYFGLAWLRPELVLPVFVYLGEFMVIDCFLSLAFLAWPIRSPNYFYVVDRPLWLWNWSKAGKAANSGAFAVLLLVTGSAWLGLAVAAAMLVVKTASLARLARIGLPVPAR